LFTRLAVAEAELRAMKEMLAKLLDVLADVTANQDELRQDHDDWRWWAERVLADQRKSWWRRVIRRIGMIDPKQLTSRDDKALRPNALGLIFRTLVIVIVGLLFWHAVLAAVKP
jgi:hypothetical protein